MSLQVREIGRDETAHLAYQPVKPAARPVRLHQVRQDVECLGSVRVNCPELDNSPASSLADLEDPLAVVSP